MSVPDRRKRRRKSERSSLQILEECFHLLRTVDVKYYWWFYLGTVPFAVGLLYFTADQSRSSLAEQSILPASIFMALLYLFMRWCQAKFCVGLWDTVSPGNLPRRKAGDRFRSLAALWFLHALQVPLLLVGLFFAIPLGWILAAQQNFTILSASRECGEKPLRTVFFEGIRHSHYDWAQNHGILLVMAIVALFTWVNLVATCLVLPGFAKSFFGVESVFTVSPTAAIMNTSFLLGSFLLTWLVISPMMKAAYTLRCFYCDSQHTGADLLSRLAACREERSRQSDNGEKIPFSRAASLLLPLLLLPVSGAGAEPVDTAPVRPAGEEVSREQFERSIGETMEQKKYQWQLSRKSLGEDEADEENWLSRRINEIAGATRDAFKAFADWLEEIFDKWNENDRPSTRSDPNIDPGIFNSIGSTLSIGLIVLVSVLIAWLVLILYRRYRGIETIRPDEVTDAGEIDLQSEEIVASQLPEDEWMRLAREQISKGDTRLAVRALFLATLAKLGEDGLLRIAKFKSNRDYRLELLRKARKSESLLAAFETNTGLFERAWYGWHPVSGEAVETFLANHEMIAGESGKWARKHQSDPEPAGVR